MKITAESLFQLKTLAVEASLNAYSPYSEFSVGAAVMDSAGNSFSGCNVENASYGMTQCAERNAIAAAIAGGSVVGSLTSMVIYVAGNIAHPPCGACRQVMQELMAEESEVISCCDGDAIRVWAPSEYLPDHFVFPDLN